jgi:predicted nucleotidyltransferase
MGMIEEREKKITQEIDSIVRQIISKYHPIKIILFGSAAKSDLRKANDLDFLIIKDDVPQFGIDRMRELDEIIERDMAADMLVYRPVEFDERVALGDPFIKSILKEGRVLYG